eukprot:356850-Chlamydomonas_euryale.AAC.1
MSMLKSASGVRTCRAWRRRARAHGDNGRQDKKDNTQRTRHSTTDKTRKTTGNGQDTKNNAQKTMHGRRCARVWGEGGIAIEPHLTGRAATARERPQSPQHVQLDLRRRRGHTCHKPRGATRGTQRRDRRIIRHAEHVAAAPAAAAAAAAPTAVAAAATLAAASKGVAPAAYSDGLTSTRVADGAFVTDIAADAALSAGAAAAAPAAAVDPASAPPASAAPGSPPLPHPAMRAAPLAERLLTAASESAPSAPAFTASIARNNWLRPVSVNSPAAARAAACTSAASRKLLSSTPLVASAHRKGLQGQTGRMQDGRRTPIPARSWGAGALGAGEA